MARDERLHRRGKHPVHRLAAGKRRAYARTGYILGAHFLKYQPSSWSLHQLAWIDTEPPSQPRRKRFIRWRKFPARTLDDDQMRELRQLTRAVP